MNSENEITPDFDPEVGVGGGEGEGEGNRVEHPADEPNAGENKHFEIGKIDLPP